MSYVCPSVYPHGTTGLHWRGGYRLHWRGVTGSIGGGYRLHWRGLQAPLEGFQDILFLSIFRKPDKNNGYCMWGPTYIADSSCTEMLQTAAVQKIETHFIYSHFFFPKVVSLRDNVEKYYRTTLAVEDNIILRKRIACWITKAADTHSEYAILIAFPQ